MVRVSRSVLVVMPDDSERRRVVDVVEATGHTATAAGGTLEAISFQQSFDLVILSVAELVDRDLEFFELVNRKTPHVRILLLVPDGRRMDALRYMEPAQGDMRPRADATIGLPFFETELRTVVTSLLRFEAADELTGLANRPAHELSRPRELAAAERSGKTLALGLLDIDDFGALNKSIGYTRANEVLREFARILRTEFRDGVDILARWGGEEFVVLAPNFEPTRAMKDIINLFERVRVRVAETAFETTGGDVSITVSGGVARFPDDVAGLLPPAGRYLEEARRVEVGFRLFQVANERLIEAKRRPEKNTILYEGP